MLLLRPKWDGMGLFAELLSNTSSLGRRIVFDEEAEVLD
jgi:hypothetical protein